MKSLVRRYRRNNSLLTPRNALLASLIVVIPFVLLFLLGETATGWLNQIDRNIGYLFHSARTFERTEIAIGITRLADFEGQAIITIFTMLVLFSLKKWKASLWFGLTVLIGSEYINGFAKNIFERIRPDYVEHLIVQDGFAFPSGHAMGSMIIFGAILFLVVQYFPRKVPLKWTVGFITVFFILFIGLSRVYLGVHYPSDVLGGYSLGAAWLLLSIGLFGLSATD